MKLKHFFKHFLYLPVISILLLLVSCGDDEINYKGESSSSFVYMESELGTKTVEFRTNAPWTAEVPQETHWACLQDASGNMLRSISGEKNGSITIFHTRNTAFNRVGSLLIHFSNSSIVDTLYLKQYGEIAPMLELRDSLQISVAATGGVLSARIETNLTAALADRITIETDYPDESRDWIVNPKVNNLQSISFTVKSNSTGIQRSATIRAMYTDDFNEKRRLSTCRIVQNP